SSCSAGAFLISSSDMSLSVRSLVVVASLGNRSAEDRRVVHRPDGTEETDRLELRPLIDLHALEPHQLKQSDEHQDHLSLRVETLENRHELQRFAGLDHAQQFVDGLVETLSFAFDFMLDQEFSSIEQLLERGDQ